MTTNALYLVCDMINDLVHEEGPNGKTGFGPELARRNTIARTAEALAKARAAGVKVGYVRIGFSADYRECPPRSRIFQNAKKAGLFKLGTWGTEVHPALQPQAGDFDIVKHRVSPFYATDLDAILRAHAIQRLYVSGVSTGGVVLSAAKEGHDRDYDVCIIEDCCAAMSGDQHLALVSEMTRLAAIATAASVTFAEMQ
jgi:nicotinamidase-related amidase